MNIVAKVVAQGETITVPSQKAENGPDYTLWIDDNNRISRRKRLAQEFDQHLTEYFKRGREEVMKGVRE